MADKSKKFETTITHNSIKNQIDENIRNGLDALNEYIWNSIDAGSKKIEVNLVPSNDLSKDLFSTAEIIDNGTGIDFKKFKNKEFVTFNNSWKEKKRNLSLPHGHRGYGRFSFIKFCKSIKWESTFKENSGELKSYSISLEGSDLLKNIVADIPTGKETGTRVIFSNFLSNNDLIKDSKIEHVIESIKSEFAWVVEMLNIDFKINNQKLDYSNLFKTEPTLEEYTLNLQSFNIKIILWNKRLTNYDSRYHLIDSKNLEKFTKQISLASLEELNASVYIKSKFFDDFDNFLVSRSKSEESLFPKEKVYLNLFDHVENKLNESATEFKDYRVEERYKEIIGKKYFDEMFSEGLESDIKKPIVAKLTKQILKIDEDVLKTKNDKQNKIILNLINGSLDNESSRESLIRVLKLLLNDNNQKQIENFEKELEKYKLENIVEVTKEIERRFKALKYFEKVIYDKDFYYYESDLQKMIEKNFWIFGEQYHLIGGENDKYSTLIEVYYKKILKFDDKVIEETKKSLNEVDLMISRIDPGFGGKIVNTIVEIKRPGSPSNLKESNLLQIKGYANDIAEIKKFNSNNEEWIFILVGSDYDKDIKYIMKGDDGFVLEKPDVHQKIYIKKWADILLDAKFRMEYLKKKLELKEKKIAEDVEKEIKQAKGERQKFLDTILN